MYSPYLYCKNNPILRIDLDGKDDYIVDSNWRYFLGVSKDGTSHSLVRIYTELRNCFQPYVYPSLRKYLFDTSYNENEKPLFVLNYQSILVDEQFIPGNCLKEHIKGLNYFMVDILGTYDFSLIKQIRTPSQAEFMTLNGKDTLRYTINTVYTDDFCLDALKNIRHISQVM